MRGLADADRSYGMLVTGTVDGFIWGRGGTGGAGPLGGGGRFPDVPTLVAVTGFLGTLAVGVKTVEGGVTIAFGALTTAEVVALPMAPLELAGVGLFRESDDAGEALVRRWVDAEAGEEVVFASKGVARGGPHFDLLAGGIPTAVVFPCGFELEPDGVPNFFGLTDGEAGDRGCAGLRVAVLAVDGVGEDGALMLLTKGTAMGGPHPPCGDTCSLVFEVVATFATGSEGLLPGALLEHSGLSVFSASPLLVGAMVSLCGFKTCVASFAITSEVTLMGGTWPPFSFKCSSGCAG